MARKPILKKSIIQDQFNTRWNNPLLFWVFIIVIIFQQIEKLQWCDIKQPQTTPASIRGSLNWEERMDLAFYLYWAFQFDNRIKQYKVTSICEDLSLSETILIWLSNQNSMSNTRGRTNTEASDPFLSFEWLWLMSMVSEFAHYCITLTVLVSEKYFI